MRDWQVRKALTSFRSLVEVIDELTEEEVLHCLQVEVESQRRSTIVDKLLAKAADLNRQTYVVKLKEKLKWHVQSL